jgi:hypothetical protein
MNKELQPVSEEMKEALRDWVQQVSSCAAEHKLSITAGLPYPDSLKDAILKQATPFMFRGNTVIFVTVGSGITKSGFLGNEPFYNGSSAAACLMKNFFSRLHN